MKKQMTDKDYVAQGALMYNGTRLELTSDGFEGIHLINIAQGLALENRYGGQTIAPYTVAQHSVILAMHVPSKMKRYALMHDATEHILGDEIRPVKSLIAGYEEQEKKLSDRIYRKYGVVPIKELYDFDTRITVDEIKVLMKVHANSILDGIEPLGVSPNYLKPWHWKCARDTWLQCFGILFPEHQKETNEALIHFAKVFEPQPIRYVAVKPKDLE